MRGEAAPLEPAQKPIGVAILGSNGAGPRQPEGSISQCFEITQGEILRFARDDSIGTFFRSLLRISTTTIMAAAFPYVTETKGVSNI